MAKGFLGNILKKNRNIRAFTIVELLVVIVVIGILAAITVISYTGISQKAITTSLKSDLSNASKQLELDKAVNGSYPISASAADSGRGLRYSPNTSLQYTVNSNGFCIGSLSSVNSSIAYHITSTFNQIATGGCFSGWKQIVTGTMHVCGIASDDKIYCWGRNYDGQLGNGTNIDSTTPVQVLSGDMPAGVIKMITAGDYHTCAIASDDKAYCWGYNGDGELGSANFVSSNLPVAVSFSTFKSIDTGDYHTCAIASDDKAYCWGYNYSGQLGNTSNTDSNVPVQVSAGAMPAGAVKSVISGGATSCAIASDDRPYCWGYNGDGELGNTSNTDSNVPVQVSAGAVMPAGAIKMITVGVYHVCVIASDDKGYCWGYNYVGQLGNNSRTSVNVPVRVSTGATPNGTIKSISAGNQHTCAIASDDKAYCWGDNLGGELGIGSHTVDRTTAVQVLTSSLPVGAIKSVIAGGDLSCAIASDGNAYCWGNNTDGEIAIGYKTNINTPSRLLGGVMPTGTVKAISTSGSNDCAIASDDWVYCWGLNNYGQLGDGTTNTSNTPVRVSTGAMPAGAVKAISVGATSACAVASDDRIYCWGRNYYGQLGNNTFTSSSVPVQVVSGVIPAGIIKSISVGVHHVCAVASDDKAYCWGRDTNGELGNGAPNSASSIPVVVTLGTVKYISAGGYHTCAIASDDKIYCWGWNVEGQLGIGSTSSKSVPTLISAGALPVGVMKSVSSGSYFTCAIASDDKVYCWGEDYDGQLGNGSSGNLVNVAVQVVQGEMPVGAVKSIDVGGYHVCAVASDDKLYCWGYNYYGELGTSSFDDSNIPVKMPFGAMPSLAVKSLVLGYTHSCAIASDDWVYCWGDNFHGQLGTGLHSGLNLSAPVQTFLPF